MMMSEEEARKPLEDQILREAATRLMTSLVVQLTANDMPIEALHALYERLYAAGVTDSPTRVSLSPGWLAANRERLLNRDDSLPRRLTPAQFHALVRELESIARGT